MDPQPIQAAADAAVAHGHAKRAAGALRRAVTELARTRQAAGVLDQFPVTTAADARSAGALIADTASRHGPVLVVLIAQNPTTA